MKINIDGKKLVFDNPTRIIDMFSNDGYKYMACYVDNTIKELNYTIKNDAKIELLDIKNNDVVQIYQATLRYIVAMAIRNLYPNTKVVFNYSVSRSIFVSISNLGHAVFQNTLDEIKNEVNRIIKEDYPINKMKVSTEKAVEIYHNMGFIDKENILKYRNQDYATLYECNGYYNYMYNFMLPSTGYVKNFDFIMFPPGFLILYPRAETGGEIPVFSDEDSFRKTLREANIWSNKTGLGSISQINENVTKHNTLEFINICEAGHNRQLAEIGNNIESNISNIKLICIAGPSSSGKTTFTNRVRIELKSRGINPLMISMDNFYKNKEKCPLDENGNYDFEHIEALDLELFDSIILKLINGESVALPIFDFKTGTRTFSEEITIKSRQPILIEGIHGLNERICPSIPDEQKYRIFIAPLAQYHIDDHNPISLSDIRLIRRIVRDNATRGSGCENTILTWQSVRNGEFKWIYPYQDNANYVFNSELRYELCVMKKHVEPLLQEVKKGSNAYVVAKRLSKFIKYFNDIKDKWVPNNSILREFIGESIFYTDDID